MRADRLISLLLLLQTHGRMTARHLGGLLEVSERTIYRDLDALSAAGIPVYAVKGPGGGCDLVESYRTSLTGLTADEVQALFMLSIPAPLTQLGVGRDLRSALLKISAAFQLEGAWVRQRIHLDSKWWHQAEEAVPFLATLQAAVWRDHQVRIRYQMPFRTEIEQILDPLGLVAKSGVWYLVHGLKGAVRGLRVSRILQAESLESTFKRPEAFDLAAAWNLWCAAREQLRAKYPVLLRVDPEVVDRLPFLIGLPDQEILEENQSITESGWVRMVFHFENLEAARARLLGLGGAVEVLEPEALRRSMLDFARQTLLRYQLPEPVLRADQKEKDG